MKIGLYHGYELSGSGSNEYNRYLARTLIFDHHTVHIICREPRPEKLDFLQEVWHWREDGTHNIEKCHNHPAAATGILHTIPTGPILPVYLTDKQRPGKVKSLVNLSTEELEHFVQLNEFILTCIFAHIQLDLLFANHLVMQPTMALKPCRKFQIPLIIFPHGSAIEYVVKKDRRYHQIAAQALHACDAIITGNKEVKERLITLFPELRSYIEKKTTIVGVGVDTKLFTPVGKNLRPQKLLAFRQSALLDNPSGKSPDVLMDLHRDLQAGKWHNITNYRDRYKHDDLDRDIISKLEKIDTSNPQILFLGSLTAGKGVQSLLCALPLIYRTYPDLQLSIIGSGAYREVLEAFVYAIANRDKDLMVYLAQKGFDLESSTETGPWQDVMHYLTTEDNVERLCFQSRRLMEQVYFLGRMDHDQLSYLFPCMDLAIFPSVIPEAYPLVLMESLANGVIPMVSYFSGFKDGIDDLQPYLPADMLQLMKIPIEADRRITSIADNIVALLAMTRHHDWSVPLSNIARKQHDWSIKARSLVQAFQTIIKPV